jgi:hypothetical protein
LELIFDWVPEWVAMKSSRASDPPPAERFRDVDVGDDGARDVSVFDGRLNAGLAGGTNARGPLFLAEVEEEDGTASGEKPKAEALASERTAAQAET